MAGAVDATERRPQIHSHWELLDNCGSWERLIDEFLIDPCEFQERHYREFVTFLPHVQRMLYGEGSVGTRAEQRESPIRVYRRKDISKVELILENSSEPVVLEVAHVDLYFFYDADLVILALEVFGNDLPLPVVQDLMFLFGRAYPSGWRDDGLPFHCTKIAWLGKDGEVLAVSDFEDREKFLTSVCRHRAVALGAHWEFLLEPMVPHQPADRGTGSSSTTECLSWRFLRWMILPNSRGLTMRNWLSRPLAEMEKACRSLRAIYDVSKPTIATIGTSSRRIGRDGARASCVLATHS